MHKPHNLLRSLRSNGHEVLSYDVRDGLRCVLSRGRHHYAVIASWGQHTHWEHVSVHLLDNRRLPTWDEMCWLKDLFWPGHETVVQYHPADVRRLNIHPRTLHLWRPMADIIPEPSLDLV